MAAICSAVAQGGLTCHTLLGLAGHLPPAPQTVGGHLVFSPLAGLRGTGAPCKESSAGRQRHRLTCRSGLSSRTGQPRPPANPLGLSRRDQQDLDHLAKVYIVREGVLLKLVLEYLETSPKARLGRATHDSSSPGWDAIAIETLSTCLRGTFPSSLYEMYEAISAERKLAAGIPSRHHWPGGRRSHLRHYHHRDKQRDDQIDTEWVLRREQQRQDYQKEERRRATAAPTFIATDNVGSSWEDQGSQNPYVQLARAQRLVDAAASSLAVLVVAARPGAAPRLSRNAFCRACAWRLLSCAQ